MRGIVTSRANRSAGIKHVKVIVAVSLILLSLVLIWFIAPKQNSNDSNISSSEPAGDYDVQSIDLGGISDGDASLLTSQSLSVNGQLRANNSLVLTPGNQPDNVTTGQMYYDAQTNTPYIYDGETFQPLVLGQPVQSIGGASGNITVGSGILLSNNQLSLDNSVLNVINQAASAGSGVSSLQGQTGDVTLTSGNGISVNGTTIANTGVVSITAASPQLTVSQGPAGAYSIGVASGLATATGTAGTIAVFDSSNNLVNSLLTQTGTVLSAAGDVQVTGQITTDSITGLSSGGELVIAAAPTGDLVFEVGGRSFVFPSTGPTSQTICTLAITCTPGGGTASVTLQPSTVQEDIGSGASIFINNTGGGELLHLQGNTVDAFVVENNGDTAIGGDTSVAGDLTVSGAINASTINGGVITGGTVSGGSISGGTLTGSSVNGLGVSGTAITATGAFNINAGSGQNININTSGGGTINLGTSLMQGAGAITIAAGGSNQDLTLEGSGTGSVIIDVPVFHNANGATYTFNAADTGATNAVICTSIGNCIGSGAAVGGGGTGGVIALWDGVGSSFTLTDSLLSQAAGAVTVSGDLIATNLQGNGSSVTNVNAAQLNGQAASYYTNASNIGSGTLNSDRLAADVAQMDQAANFTVSLAVNGDAVCTVAGNCAGTGAGVGGSGTPGTIAVWDGAGFSLTDSLIAQDTSGPNGLITLDGDVVADSFSGSGAGLTNVNAVTLNGQLPAYYLNAGNMNAGTLDDARLSANVAKYNDAIAAFLGNGSFVGTVSGADAINGNEFVTLDQLDAAVGGGGGGVTSLNGLDGDMILQGTTGQITVGDNGTDTLTLALDSAVTLQGNVVNAANGLVKLDAGGLLPAVNGSLLTNVNAATLQGQAGSYYLDLGNATGTLNVARIADASLTNAKLQNSSLTVTAGNGLTTGGSVSLGGTTTLNIGAGDGISVTADAIAVDTTVCRTTGNCAGSGAGVGGSAGAGVGTLALWDGTYTIKDSSVSVDVSGNVTVAGDVAANNFSGNGSALTNLNASALASGTVGDARLSTNVTLQGNAINTANGLVRLNASTQLPALDGSLLTTLNASALTSGTVSDSRLSSNVALLNADADFTGAFLRLNGDDVCTVAGNCLGSGGGVSGSGTANTIAIWTGSGFTLGDSLLSQSAGTVTVAGDLVATNLQGNGSAITSLNASSVSTGTLADARLSTNVTLQGNIINAANGLVKLNASGQLPALDGALLTNLNASALTNGTVSDARLSSNVALLNLPANFTGALQQGGDDVCTTAGNCLGGGGGGVAGSGTVGTIAMWDGNSFTLGDSLLSQNAGDVVLSGTGSGTITTGGTNQTLTLSGNGTGGVSILVPTFQNAAGASYTFDTGDASGIYDICTTAGNCLGSGGGVAGSGTAGTIAMWDGNSFTLGDSLLSQSGGTVTVAGDLAATNLQGNGSAVTNVDAVTLDGLDSTHFTNASNLNTGTLADARLSGNVTLAGNTFNTANNLVQLNATGQLPALDGSLLTNVNAAQLNGQAASYYTNASNLSGGTLSDARLSANVALLNASANFTGALQQGGDDVCTTAGNCAGTGGVVGGTGTAGTIAVWTGTGLTIGDSLLSQVGSVVTVSGDLAATNLQGNGSAVTNLNASNVATGTLSDARLSANVTLAGNTFNTANNLVRLNASGQLPALDGSLLTSVNAATLGGNAASYYTNASNISSGTLSDSRLSGNVALLNALSQTFTGDVAVTGALTQGGNAVCTTAGNCAGTGAGVGGSGTPGTIAIWDGTGFTLSDSSLTQDISGNITVAGDLAATNLQGNGSAITDINASAINSGTLADARLSSNVTTAGNTFNTANNLVQLNASGQLPALDGSLLTNLNASSIATGTLADARLSANIARLGNAANFTGASLQYNGQNVCTTAGNCVGTGVGSAIGGGGTQYSLAMFTPDGFNIGDSIAAQNAAGTIMTISGQLSATSLSASAGASITGNSTVVGTLTGLTGVTSSGTITFSGLSTPGVVHNDGSGVLSTSLITNADLQGGTYGAITGVGALNAGSIASGFGTINTTNAITTTVTVTGGTFNATTGGYQTDGTTRLGDDGSLQDITGYAQTGGNFVQGGGGTFDTGTGAVSLNGAATANSTLNVVGATTLQSNLTVNGAQFTNNGSTLNTALVLGDFPAGGSIGTAGATVDNHTAISIPQTTTGQILDIPSPTSTVAGRVLYLFNTGTQAFTIEGASIAAGYSQTFVWNGTAWVQAANGGGTVITLQGAYDGGNVINTTDAKNIQFTLSDTATDADFITNIATGSSGQFKVQNNGTDVLSIGSTGQLGLAVQGAAGGLAIGGDTQIYRSATNRLFMANSLTVRPTVDSTTALQIQQAGGTDILTVDTVGGLVTVGGDLTVAASKSLRLVGGNTASRPASPTAGMLYYDTTTNQMLQYNGTKWVSDARTATKTVAASNSSQAMKDAADYVATGTSDHTIINTALTAAAGGAVYLMEGTYTLGGAISVPNNTTLSGAGAGTIITVPNSFNTSITAIANTTTGGNGTGIVIRDVTLDGNKANQSSGTQRGIYLNGAGSGAAVSSVQGARVMNVTVRNWLSEGFVTSGSSNTIINGVTSTLNGGHGFNITSGANITFTGNTSQGNGGRGSSFTSVSSSAVTGNTSQGNTGTGFLFDTATYNTVTGNTSQGNVGNGIYVTAGSSNTVSSNNISGNGSNGIGIVGSSSNNITDNRITDSNGTTDNNGIFLDNSDSNSIQNNYITDGNHTVTNYAINISNSTSDTNYLSGNTYGVDNINNAGTGTVFAGQVTDSSGTYSLQPAGNINVGTDATARTISVGTGAANNTVTVGSTTGTSTTNLQAGSGGVNITAKTKVSVTDTAALLIQNASATALLTADTSTMQIVIGTTSNGITLSANGITLAGTARNAKTILLSPEYENTVLNAGTGSNNTGTMTSNYDVLNRMNYYNWTTSQGSDQSYDIVTQVPLPKDFAAWDSTTPVSVTGWTSNTTSGTILMEVRDSAGAVKCNFVAVTPGSASTWSTNTTACTYALLTASTPTYTPGDYITIRIRLQAPTGGNNTRVGNIKLNYLSNK